MPNRNVDKGREAENAVARELARAGMVHAERRSKRGGTVELECDDCGGIDLDRRPCDECGSTGRLVVPADAGDITGIPGVVVQVKWSGYAPLTADLSRTDEQRRVARADVGLLVRKRKGVGLARAGEWDAYLPTWQLVRLILRAGDTAHPLVQGTPVGGAPWSTSLATVAELLSMAGYGTHRSPLEVTHA